MPKDQPAWPQGQDDDDQDTQHLGDELAGIGDHPGGEQGYAGHTLASYAKVRI